MCDEDKSYGSFSSAADYVAYAPVQAKLRKFTLLQLSNTALSFVHSHWRVNLDSHKTKVKSNELEPNWCLDQHSIPK